MFEAGREIPDVLLVQSPFIRAFKDGEDVGESEPLRECDSVLGGGVNMGGWGTDRGDGGGRNNIVHWVGESERKDERGSEGGQAGEPGKCRRRG